MSGVQAVVTTGIYCRPGCGGRPLPGHVRRFDLAAAAEAAGYRACLRCRPYRATPPPQIAGPEVVCRAVRLILEGALDRSTEDQLGSRLGVSARHLRRLFQLHLGVSPDRLARSRRAHFARRLLDDTDLTITHIAMASGFGSARQMNRVLASVFRAPPRELRARRRAHDRLAADGGLALRLPFRPPLDWDGMLAFLATRAIGGVETVSEATYRRTVTVEGLPALLEWTRGGPDHLRLTAHLGAWGGLIHVAQRARRVFNLDFDLEGARAHLAGDPILGPLLAARPGARPPGIWEPFEAGVRAIVGQQVSVAGARTIVTRLVARLGTPVPGLGRLGLTHLFPEPPALLAGDLSGLGLTRARAAALRAFADAVTAGAVALEGTASLDQLVGSLTQVPGLGPWTAQYIALRLGEPDAFPATDLGVRRALAGQLGRPVSHATVREISAAWQPWRGLAAVHLWLAGAAPVRPGTVGAS